MQASHSKQHNYSMVIQCEDIAFSNDYYKNHEAFLRAATRSSAQIKYHVAPSSLRLGAATAKTTVALAGNETASNVVVITSGVHGVELPYGTVMQRLWLQTAKHLCTKNSDIRFVFVHALNPIGAVLGQRGNPSVDLNRNFIDFKKPLPATSDSYEALHSAFTPDRSKPFAVTISWMKMLWFTAKNGLKNFKQALAGGQYSHSSGLYFGGTHPSWNRLVWEDIVEKHVLKDGTQKVTHVDIHSGDGDYGVFSIMLNQKDAFERVKHLGNTELNSLATISGDIIDSWYLPAIKTRTDKLNCTVTPMTISVGTSKLGNLDVLNALVTRDPQKLQNAFNPPNKKWRDNAVNDGMAFFENLLPFVQKNPWQRTAIKPTNG